MDLEKQTQHLRRQVVQRGSARGHAPELIAAILAHVESRRAQGDTVAGIVGELGIGLDTYYRWKRIRPRALALRPVEVLPAVAVEVRGLTVVGPAGVRVEGLSLAQVAELVRRLA
jgi:transposase